MTTPRRGPGGHHGAQAIAAVAAGRLAPADLRADAIRRIGSWEPRLGAVTDVLRRREVSSGVLAGMIVGVKDQIDIAGYPHPLAGFGGDDPTVAIRDATVVERIEASGAILLARTASPRPGAPGGVTPQTQNPRCPDRVSGGSSGGSAAAVAAGLVHVALGTDSGGSIRIPAACCGVVGLNPTRGLVPLTGAGGLTYSIGSVGPLASTVADVRLALEAIAVVDPDDPYGVPDPRIERPAGPLRIGLPEELVGWNLDSEVRSTFGDVVTMLRDAGHRVEEMSVPRIRDSMELGPRTVGVVEYVAGLEDAFPSAVTIPQHRTLVEAASAISASDLARAYHRIAELRAGVRQVFGTYDVLVSPTLPCRVPDASGAHLEAEIEVGGAVETRTSALTRLLNPWNLAAVPAGSQPVGRDSDGAPISVQVIGPPFSDWRVLDLMESIEAATGGPWDTVAPSVSPRS